jgi:hypothetical protein
LALNTGKSLKSKLGENGGEEGGLTNWVWPKGNDKKMCGIGKEKRRGRRMIKRRRPWKGNGVLGVLS